MEELARRRVKNRKLKKKIRKLERKISEYQNGDITEYLEDSSSIPRTKRTKSIGSSVTGTDNGREEFRKSAIITKRPESGNSAISFRDVRNAKVGNSPSESTTDPGAHSNRRRPHSGVSFHGSTSGASFQESASCLSFHENNELNDNVEKGEEIKNRGEGSIVNCTTDSLKKRPQSGYSVVSFQETEYAVEAEEKPDDATSTQKARTEVNYSTEEDSGEKEASCSSSEEEEVYIRRPSWNKSTATTLLSEKAPPSVLWERNFFEESTVTLSDRNSSKKGSKKERHDLYEKLSKERARNRYVIILHNLIENYLCF